MRRASLLAILGAVLCLPKSLSSEYGDSDRGAVLYRAKRDVGYCGGTFTDIAGEFSSPQYPSNYNGNQECYYYITVPDGFYIVLQFTTFVLESSTIGDYVEIYNSHQSQNRIGIYYETTGPGVVQSSGSELLVTFYSDSSVSAQGFLAKYMVATRDYSSGTGTCGGTYSNFESGAFTSPFFPIGYLPGLDCYYSISMPTAGSKIQVEILYILTEASYDYVEVHDGNSAEATSLGNLVGHLCQAPLLQAAPSSLFTSTRTVQIEASMPYTD
ncbi:procollagen C-endopeptidase enhancer 2-like isoform X1 [Ptychodera flava]|uniref:procollagen C-endopeptidase enhancer 2-like isoform X1 n=1 Tax=Ptychodera flava TaxID=63121 RepID=UPI00396A237D